MQWSDCQRSLRGHNDFPKLASVNEIPLVAVLEVRLCAFVPVQARGAIFQSEDEHTCEVARVGFRDQDRDVMAWVIWQLLERFVVVLRGRDCNERVSSYFDALALSIRSIRVRYGYLGDLY